MIVSEKNISDSNRRRYEDEVFEYQERMLRLLGITESEDGFIRFLLMAGAYEGIAGKASSARALSDQLNTLRENIRKRINMDLERFQSEQQRTRNRINYLAGLSKSGFRGAFTRFNEELVSAVRMAQNFNLKVKDTGDYISTLIAGEMGCAVSRVRAKKSIRSMPGTLRGRSQAAEANISLLAALSAGAGLAFFGARPLYVCVLRPVLSFFALEAAVTAVISAALLILAISLRQAYSGKISVLDQSTADFMRFTAGIGKGSGIKAFLKWIVVMLLQLAAGPGLYAGAGTLVTAVAHPVILAGFAPAAIPAAFTGILAALAANLALIAAHKDKFREVRHVSPGRFKHGFNISIRTMAFLTGLMLAFAAGGGDPVHTGLGVAVILAAVLVSGVIERRSSMWYAEGAESRAEPRRFYKEKTPEWAGVTFGAAATGVIVILISLTGAGRIFVPLVSVTAIAAGIMGIGMVLLQTIQAAELARDAVKDGQSPFRAAVASFMPNTRNIMMYVIAVPSLPAAVFSFTGFVPGLVFLTVFLTAVPAGIFILYRYSVNMDKFFGRTLSKCASDIVTGSMMIPAAVIPMAVLPETAYNAQETKIMASAPVKKYSREELAGIRILGGNIKRVLSSVMSRGLRSSFDAYTGSAGRIFSGLRGDVERVYRNFNGEDDLHANSISLKCEMEPTSDNPGFTILRIREHGEYVKKGDWLYEIDSSSLKRERDEEEILVIATKGIITEQEQILEEADNRKKALISRYERDITAVNAEINSARLMLSAGEKRIKQLEDNIVLLDGYVRALSVLYEESSESKVRYEKALEMRRNAVIEKNEARGRRMKAEEMLKAGNARLEYLRSGRAQMIGKLDGITERAENALRSARKQLTIREQRCKAIETNIRGGTVYAQKDVVVARPYVTGRYVFSIPFEPGREAKIGQGCSVTKGQEIIRLVDPDSPFGRFISVGQRRSDGVIMSKAMTGESNRQGNIGLPIKMIVPEGTLVRGPEGTRQGDIIARLDDSVLEDMRKQEEAKRIEARRLIDEYSSLLDRAEKMKSVYLDMEYPAILKKAEALLSEARKIREARHGIISLAEQKKIILKARLDSLRAAGVRNAAARVEIMLARIAYNTALAEEEAAQYDMEFSRSMEEAAEADLERVRVGRAIELAYLDREINIYREKLRLARETEIIAGRRIEFYRQQIANCVIRADKTGRVSYISDQRITLMRADLNPAETELIVGEGAILPPGVPFIKINVDGEGRYGGKGMVDSYLSDIFPVESSSNTRDSVVCGIKPLRLYNITGYGATLTYVTEEGTVIKEEDVGKLVVARFDSSALEMERDREAALCGEIRLAITSAEAVLKEADIRKTNFISRNGKEQETAEAKIKKAQQILETERDKLAKAEDNITLARSEVERLASLAGRGSISPFDLDKAVLRRREAETIKQGSLIELSRALRILETARAELDALKSSEAKEIALLNGIIERAGKDIMLAGERLKIHEERLGIINENIKNCVVYAHKTGVISYVNITGTCFFSLPVRLVPGTVKIGPGITAWYGQEIMRINSDRDPAKGTPSGNTRGKSTLTGADVSTACNSGSGILYPAIKKLRVKDGEYVEKGQVIVELETSALEQMRREEELNLAESGRLAERAESSLNEIIGRKKIYIEKEYTALLAEARAVLNYMEETCKGRKESSLTAERRVLIRKRLLEIAERDVISTAELQGTRSAYNTAVMEHNKALSEEFIALSAKMTAETDLARLISDKEIKLAYFDREISIAREQLRLAREKEETSRRREAFYRTQISKCRIKAPAAGIVSYIHELPVDFLGITLETVPRERIIAEGEVTGPGPFIRITHSGRTSDTETESVKKTAAHGARTISEKEKTDSKGVFSLTCGILPLEMGRRGEHGSMVKEIAPEGPVKTGQLLVKYDTSRQEKLLEQWESRMNEVEIVSVEAAEMIRIYEGQKKALRERVTAINGIHEAWARCGKDMSAIAMEMKTVAEDNIYLARRDIGRLTGLRGKGISSEKELLSAGILLEEAVFAGHRAWREIFSGRFMSAEGDNGPVVERSRMEQQLRELEGLIERARADKAAADASIRIYSETIDLIKRNIKNSVIKAEKDGFVEYAHDTGASFAGIPIKRSARPVYIGRGSVVRNGQAVMYFFDEDPAGIARGEAEISDEGIPLISDVSTGESDWTGPLGARVLSVSKKTGDSVKAGDIILVLDPSNLEDMKRQAEMDLLETRRLADEYASLRKEKEKLLEEYLSRGRSSAIRMARARVDSAKELHESARGIASDFSEITGIKERQYRSLLKIRDRGVESEKEAEKAKGEWNSALLEEKRAVYKLRSAEVKLAEAEYNLRILECENTETEFELRSAIKKTGEMGAIFQENAAICESRKDFYRRQIENCVIKAPVDGRISYNNAVSYTFFIDRRVPREVIITPGSHIPPGIIVATIQRPDSADVPAPLELRFSAAGLTACITFIVLIFRETLKKIISTYWIRYSGDPYLRGRPDPDSFTFAESVPEGENGVREKILRKYKHYDLPGLLAREAVIFREGIAMLKSLKEMFLEKERPDGSASAGQEPEIQDEDEKNETVEEKEQVTPGPGFLAAVLIILNRIILLLTAGVGGCVLISRYASQNSRFSLGKGVQWYWSLAGTYPALNVLSFIVATAFVMIAISYIAVTAVDNSKESAGRIGIFGKRPGLLFIYFALSAGIIAYFSGIPSIASWTQAREVAEIILAALVFVTYPLSIAGTFLIGFFVRKMVLRVRVPFVSGMFKLRYNAVNMDYSEGIKRLFKGWAVCSLIAAFLFFVTPYFIAVPSGTGPGITFKYIAGWVLDTYNGISAVRPAVEVFRWSVTVMTLSALFELIIKKGTRFLNDDVPALKRVISKSAIVFLAAGLLYRVTPFLPGLLGFPAGVTPFHFLMVGEVVSVFLLPVSLYFTITIYIVSFFARRVNRVYQAPPLLNYIVARFRTNYPSLIAEQRAAIFNLSVIAAACVLAALSPDPLLFRAVGWYIAFSLRNPGITLVLWLGFTVFAAIAFETVFDKIMKIFPGTRKQPFERIIKLVSFFSAAFLISLYVMAFPSVPAWSQFTAWVEVFMLGSVIIGMPVQITGAFFSGIMARVLYVRKLVPFLAHVKTRVRDLEMHQSEALLYLLNIWKWLIAITAGLLYSASLVFSSALPGVKAHDPQLYFIYDKAVKLSLFLTARYPFINVLLWAVSIILLTVVIETSLKRAVRPKNGDEYIISRLGWKIPSAALSAGIALLAGFFPLRLKASVMAVSLVCIMGFSALELILNTALNGKASKVKDFVKGLSIPVLAAGIISIIPAVPDAASLAGFRIAGVVIALGMAGIAVYFMLSAFIMGLFTRRVNQVVQPPFVFFFLVVRWRSENPPLIIVRNMFVLAAGMTALAYVMAAQSLLLGGIMAAGLGSLMAGAFVKWLVTEKAFKARELDPNRREEKFELENGNNEPRIARDMMEAIGMTGDKYNPTKTYYYNHSLYLDTPGYRWKGLSYAARHPFSEIREWLAAFPGLLTYFAREDNYREYRFKARVRWYGDRELISCMERLKSSPDMTAKNFIKALKGSIPKGSDLYRRLELVLSNLPENAGKYPVGELRLKLLELAGQTEEDKGKIHLEIKNRLDTRMWKFETGAWEWAVPHILALADGGGTVKMNGERYIFRMAGQNRDFFAAGNGKAYPVIFRIDKKGKKIFPEEIVCSDEGYKLAMDPRTGEISSVEKIKRANQGYRVEFGGGESLVFKGSNIDRGVDPEWLPEKYKGKKCRGEWKSEYGLKKFCAYIKRYGLIPAAQVSYERLEYVSSDGEREKLLERLMPLAREYIRRINADYGAKLAGIIKKMPVREDMTKDEFVSELKKESAEEYLRGFVSRLVTYLDMNSYIGTVKLRKDLIDLAKKDAAYWRGILDSSAGKYLRAIMNSKGARSRDIKIEPEDLEYLRMTLDMNVRWRVCDDLHNPTLFTGLGGFRRTWPRHTILEVKYRGQKASPWVYRMIEALDKRRESQEVNEFPIRRQPAGKYCDSVSAWLYHKLLLGAFKARTARQDMLRLAGLENGYPESPNSNKWEGFTGQRFAEEFGMEKDSPYKFPYGIEPLGYGVSGKSGGSFRKAFSVGSAAGKKLEKEAGVTGSDMKDNGAREMPEKAGSLPERDRIALSRKGVTDAAAPDTRKTLYPGSTEQPALITKAVIGPDFELIPEADDKPVKPAFGWRDLLKRFNIFKKKAEQSENNRCI
ncbi:MAG: biotin/lipoyl-binding protein [Candidatus Omnitrophota bacterium]